MKKQKTTRVCGYYNGEKWPIQIVIPRLNINLKLEPGDYVRDSNGQKINDPSLEPYANTGNLRKELDDTPVPINRL